MSRNTPDLDELLRLVVWSAQVEPHHAALVEELAALADGGAPVAATAMRQLDEAIAGLWASGWTPVDVVQLTRRRLTEAHASLVGAAIVSDGQRRHRSGHPPHTRWQAQLDVVAARTRTGRAPAGGPEVRLLVALLSLLAHLPALPPTMPGPGEVSSDPSTAALDQRMLGRVRALLAKAESTEFQEEAEALTAKAQELIARHAIAEALLHTPDDVGDPSLRRIPVDNPYPDAKAMLLSVVAEANRCRAVHTPDLGWVTLFGYDGDLDAVELIAASLLAQATSAVARQGGRRGRDGRSTTRSFRRSFLFGFAARIGERLHAASDAQVQATGSAQPRLLPVLAARDDRLDAALNAAFPDAELRRTSISNATGWSAGQAAAEIADLGVARRRLHR